MRSELDLYMGAVKMTMVAASELELCTCIWEAVK